MWRSTFVPETIFRRSIRLKKTDRTCRTIQTHSDELNRARRRNFRELNSLSLARLTKSSTFGVGLKALMVTVLLFFLKDLSKKDSALLKLGRELKDLETVQDKLEKKEEELRSERNTVMEKKALKMYFHCKRIWRSYLTGQTRRTTLNTLLYKLSNTLRSFFAEPLLVWSW